MNKSILLADEDPAVRKMVARVLESAGYRVIRAGTSAEAADGFRAAAPDLVVWELGLASPDGQEKLGFAAAAEHPVPIVGITAWPNQQEQAARRGASAVLEKPLDLALLLQTIAELLTPTRGG